MTTVRLDPATEVRLEELADIENKSKSEVIKAALIEYLDRHFSTQTPYELGKGLFGKHGSGHKDTSRDYKTLLKGRLREKYRH
jgi:hypothetical protein